VRKASLLAHRRDTFYDDSIDRNLRDHVFASEARIAQNLRGPFGRTGVWSPHAIRPSDQTDNVGGASHTNRQGPKPLTPLLAVEVAGRLQGPPPVVQAFCFYFALRCYCCV
jgi:hypothetical protein